MATLVQFVSVEPEQTVRREDRFRITLKTTFFSFVSRGDAILQAWEEDLRGQVVIPVSPQPPPNADVASIDVRPTDAFLGATVGGLTASMQERLNKWVKLVRVERLENVQQTQGTAGATGRSEATQDVEETGGSLVGAIFSPIVGTVSALNTTVRILGVAAIVVGGVFLINKAEIFRRVKKGA